MRVLNCCYLADTGGNGIRTKWAFDKLAPDVHYRTTASHHNWLDYPVDLPWSAALHEWKRADVVHLREGFRAMRLLGAPRRPTVIHHHGTQFRIHRDTLLRDTARMRAIGLASTLDLWLMAPDDLVWAPAFYDLDWLAGHRERMDDGVLRIAHAPTNRLVKSTDTFLAAAERLGRELPVEVILIERTPWLDCLRLKGRADIYFDQVSLGYGNNAIESWAMGVPVIAGAEDATLTEMERRFGELPFVLADEDTIYEALRRLADPDARDLWGQRGYEHVQRWHSDVAGVAQLRGIYEQLAVAVAA